jgi:signal transduction histidine kinase
MSDFIEKIYNLFLPHEFQLLLWLFIICGGLCFVLIIYRLRVLQTITNDLRRHNLQLKILMQNQSDIWALWWGSNKVLTCSPELSKKFGVSQNAQMSPQYIKYLFESFDFKAFFRSVHVGDTYSQECKAASEESIFYIFGSAKRVRDDWCYTLWFRNVSHQKSKTELHNDIINELRTERDIMKDILDNVPLPLWYKDTHKKLLFCNKAYANTLETTPDQAVVDQVLLKSWQQGGRTPDLTELVLKTKQRQTQQSHIVMKNERHYVEFSEVLTPKGFVLGCLHDLSQQEMLQQEIGHLGKSTHEILEVISLPVIIYNNNKQVEFFNNPYIKMFELDPSWLETKPTFSEVLEELRAKRKIPDTEDFQVYKNKQLACFNNLLAPIEDIAYYPDGRTVRMVTAPYHNGGLMITVNDITDWLTLERRYNTLLAVHRQVADNLFEGLVVFGSDHKLQLYNSAFCRMWHYNEDELTPAPHLDTIIDKIKTRIDYKHYDASWGNFTNRIRAKIIDRSATKEGRIKLHDEVVYDFSSTPLPDGSSLLTFLDVSDRYRIEKSLLERSEALELAHGIKSDYIAMIHQGIKYPLRGILLNFADMLEKKYGDINPKYQERVKSIWLEIDHILRFIENVNDLASIESGNTSLNIEEVNIVQVMEDVKATLLESALEKKLQISLDYHDQDAYHLQGDLKRLKQIFFNLLRNAISFAVSEELIKIHITELANEIHIEVSNAKAMIPYEDTYGASKKLKKGENIITGLGFSLIKRIATLHGGSVKLNHQNGTSVRCILAKKSM